MLKQLSNYSLIKHLRLQRWRSAGVDGFLVLIFSNLVIIASLGSTLFYSIYYVARVAIYSSAEVVPESWVIILGLQLKSDHPTTDFIARLDRGITLYKKFPQSRFLALGGRTGTNTLSEAEVARDYFVAAGIDESMIILEQESSHTLENLQFARKLIMHNNSGKIVLISNRYHLARSQAMVAYMGIPHSICAAEKCFDFGLRSWLLILKEAYHLHWYKSGRWWALVTKNKKMLARLQ
jgi:uncharacterized SAM-binding protein YcdF (DUF218 family)